MPSLNYTLERGDEDIELEIVYSVERLIPAQTYGPPEDCYPAEGGEITDIAAFGPEGQEFTPTADEWKRIEQHIYDNHDYSDDGDGYD